MNQAVVLVVSPVAAEMAGLAEAELRPGLAEIALALARNVLDNPRTVSSHAAVAGKLADIVDRLHRGGAEAHRRSSLTDGNDWLKQHFKADV